MEKWVHFLGKGNVGAMSMAQKAAFAYLALPILIFFFFWVRPACSIPAWIVITVALRRIWVRPYAGIVPGMDGGAWKKLAVCLLIACIWVYFSGIGRFTYQNGDHTARNAIFHTLVAQHWPVIQEGVGEGAGRQVALIYYFAFWLPSAAVGKLVSLDAGYVAQAVWAVAGIFLAFCLFCEVRGMVKVRYLLLFIFFSGLDIVGAYILNTDIRVISADHIEWWAGMQYSSATTQLFWVFNQAIPAWLATALVLAQRDRGNLVLAYSFSILSCTLPAIGLLPVVAYQAIVCGYRSECGIKENIVRFMKEICTWANVLGGGFTGITCYLFLRDNSSGQLKDVAPVNITAYLLFLFFEAVIYFILVYRYCSKNGLYYVSLLSLMLIPFMRVGAGGDFVMRASIPALVILYLLVAETVDKSIGERNYPIFAALSLAIVIGSVTPAHECIRTFQQTVAGNLNIGESVLYNGNMPNNFYGYTDRNFFFQYLVNHR